MKNYLIVGLLLAVTGCSTMTPQEKAAAEARQAAEVRECRKLGRLPVTHKYEVICADEHMFAMWRSQGEQCAANPYGTPKYYGKYMGVPVIFGGCHIDHWTKTKDRNRKD